MISITPTSLQVRAYKDGDGDPYAEKRPYSGVAQISIIDRLAYISAMQGSFKKGDIHAILDHLKAIGMTHVFAQRANGHTIPWGHRIECGAHIDGWFEIDLSQVPVLLVEDHSP